VSNQWHGLTAEERNELRQLLRERARLLREMGKLLRSWRVESQNEPFSGFQSRTGRF
jgi:hypothetical protein